METIGNEVSDENICFCFCLILLFNRKVFSCS